MPVNTKHAEYDETTWRMCRDASGGEKYVHAAGTLYLPKLAEEKDEDYKARRKRTPFFNATFRTISGLVGMLFRKPPQLVAPQTEDIDGAGTQFDTFAYSVSTECMTVGRCGVLVDYSGNVPEGSTRAEAEATGARPIMAMYRRESIINWRYTRSVLSMVVLCEHAEIPGKDEFEVKTEERYRVLDLAEGFYRQRVFRIDERGNEQLLEETFPTMNGQRMSYIPFEFVGDDGEPPLIDLVTMNLHHYSVGADYEHGCHFSGLPTLFISGFQGDSKIYIGGPTANALPDPTSRAYFVETTSDFAALRTNLEDKKSQMAVLGARMLETQRDGVEAAETTAQHRKGEESQLSAMAQSISRSLRKVLQWYADWWGQSREVEFEINRDFLPIRMGAQELTALVGAWQSGAISGDTLHQNLQRGEIVAPDVTYEDEQARIGNAAPTLAGTVEPAAPAADTGTADAIMALVAAMADAKTAEPPVINVAAPIVNLPAPVVNIEPPIVNVPAPVINMPEQQAPTINIAPPAITIEQPAITVNTPDVNVAPPAITVNNTPARTMTIQRDADGNITGGTSE